MVGGSGGRDSGLKAEINVTPLVDVVLVLLIIFMVVTPMLTRGKEVQLPVAGATENESSTTTQNAIVLTITADKRLWLETRSVTQQGLTRAIEKHFADSKNQEVLIKADASVSVRDLRPVLQKLKSAGAEQISFAVLGQKAEAP